MTPLLHRRFSSWNCSALSWPSRVAMTPLLVATLRLAALLLFGLFRGVSSCSPAILLPPNYHFPSSLVLPLHFLILLNFPNPLSFRLFILSFCLCSPRLIPCPLLYGAFSLPYSFILCLHPHYNHLPCIIHPRHHITSSPKPRMHETLKLVILTISERKEDGVSNLTKGANYQVSVLNLEYDKFDSTEKQRPLWGPPPPPLCSHYWWVSNRWSSANCGTRDTPRGWEADSEASSHVHNS